MSSCGDRSLLLQIKNEADSSLKLFKDLDSQYKSIEGGERDAIEASIEELAAVDLHSLPVEELDRLAQQACQVLLLHCTTQFHGYTRTRTD